MRRFLSQLVLVGMLFLLVGCTPFGGGGDGGDDNENPAPALNVGGENDGENGGDDEGEAEGGEQEGDDD
jgi:hypothetical protein